MINFAAVNYAWIVIKIKAMVLLHVRKSTDYRSYKMFAYGFKEPVVGY